MAGASAALKPIGRVIARLFKLVRSNIGRIVFWLLVLLLAAMVTVWAAIESPWTLGIVVEKVLPKVNGVVPGEVRVGAYEGSLGSRIVLDDVEVFDHEGQRAVQVARIEVDWDVWDLLAGRIDVHRVRVVRPDVHLRILPDGGGINLVRAFVEPKPDKKDKKGKGGGGGLRIGVQDIDIVGAHVLVDLPSGEPLEVDDVALFATWSMARGAQDVTIRSLRATPRSPVAIPPVEVAGDAVLDGLDLALTDFVLSWQETALQLDGTLRLDNLAADLTVDLRRFELDDLKAFAPDLALTGVLDGALTVQGKLTDVVVLSGDLDVDDGAQIALRKVQVGLPGGERTVIEHELDVGLVELSPGWFLGGNESIPGDLSADVSWTGSGTTLDDLAGAAVVDARPFELQGMTIGPSHVDARLDGPVVTMRQVGVGFAGGEVHVTGVTDVKQHSFDVALDGLLADLGRLRGVTKGALTGGSASFEGVARGSWGGDPYLAETHSRMEVEVRGLAAGPATVRRVELGWDLDLDLPRADLPLMRGPISVVAHQVATSGVEQLRRAEIGGLLQGASSQFQVQLSRGSDLLLNTGGFAQWTELPTVAVRDDGLQVLAGDQELHTEGPFHVELRSGAVELTDLDLRTDSGRLTLDASYDPADGALTADLDLVDLDLAEVGPLLTVVTAAEEPIDLGVAGRVERIAVDASGTRAAPILTVAVALREVAHRRRSPQDLDLELRAIDGLLAGFARVDGLAELTVGKVPLTLRLDGEAPVAVLAEAGEWDVNLDLVRRPMADLEPIADVVLPAQLSGGSFSGGAWMRGPTSNPEASLRVVVKDLQVGERELNVTMGGYITDERLDLSATRVKTTSEGTLLSLVGNAKLPLGSLLLSSLGPAELRGQDVPLLSSLELGADLQKIKMSLVHEFVPALKPLTGALRGKVEVAGELAEPRIALNLRVDGARAGPQDLHPIELVANIDGGELQGGFQILPMQGGRLTIEVGAPLPLSLSPVPPVDELLGQDGLLVELTGDGFPLPVLLAFVPEVWESSGALTLNGTVTGSLLAPVPDLALGFADAHLCYKKTGICYEELTLDSELSPDRFALNALSFRAVPQVVNPIDLARGRGPVPGNDASFSATGTLELDGIRPKRLDLEVEIDRMWAMYIKGVQVQLHGGLSAHGDFPALVVEGDIELQNVDVDLGQEDLAARSIQSMDLPENLHVHRTDSRRGPGERVVIVVEELPEGREEGLVDKIRKESTVDVQIVLTNNVRVALSYGIVGSNEAAQVANLLGNIKPDLKLEGDIRILMEKGALALQGEIGMGRNSELTVLTRNFKIDEDSNITFVGDLMDSQLGLEAVFASNYGDISVLVTESLGAPRIEFASDEVEDQSDIMAILVTGKPLSELGSAEGSGATAAIVQALAGFTTKAFGKYVPVDSLNVELGDDLSSGSVEAGKAITPYVFFLARYRWGVDDDENRVEGQLEVRLRRRLYLEFRIGDRLEGSADVLGKVIF
jgi:hypothetical protein